MLYQIVFGAAVGLCAAATYAFIEDGDWIGAVANGLSTIAAMAGLFAGASIGFPAAIVSVMGMANALAAYRARIGALVVLSIIGWTVGMAAVLCGQ